MEFKIQGPKLLIKLEEYSQPKSGIINPLYVDGITDGGKPMSQIDEFPLAPIGTVTQMGEYTVEQAKELGYDIKVGDRVVVQRQMLHPSNYFYMNPDQKNLDITDEDERHILVSLMNIQAIVND